MKITVFLILGIIAIIAGLVYSSIMFNSSSASDGLVGIYTLFGLIPVVIIIVIDRICVRRFGVGNVNKIELYILGALLLLFILNWVRLQR